MLVVKNCGAKIGSLWRNNGTRFRPLPTRPDFLLCGKPRPQSSPNQFWYFFWQRRPAFTLLDISGTRPSRFAKPGRSGCSKTKMSSCVARVALPIHHLSFIIRFMLRAALIDMYNGESNRGIPMLRSMLSRYANVLRFDHFDVRAKNEVPDLSYDIYLFSGGPGDPLLNDGPWFERFFNLIENLWRHNCRTAEDGQKKHCFFICHSFQMACHHFGLGAVQLRYKMSFGTYPVHRTHWGKVEPFFEGLPDPFYIADFRRYQVVKPTPRPLRTNGRPYSLPGKIAPAFALRTGAHGGSVQSRNDRDTISPGSRPGRFAQLFYGTRTEKIDCG
jgi:GMP synthase-like glutamine amidotransferase